MTIVLPSAMIEASNGALLVVICFMLVGDAVYIWRELYHHRWSFVYHERKAAIALFVFLLGMMLRTGVVWIIRHAENHNQPPVFFAPAASGILVIGTVLLVVGGLCWLRVTQNHEWPRYLWVVIGICALVFGAYFAMP